MGWRGVGGVKVWVIDKLLVSESKGELYSHTMSYDYTTLF